MSKITNNVAILIQEAIKHLELHARDYQHPGQPELIEKLKTLLSDGATAGPKKSAKPKAGEPPKPSDVTDQTWIDFLAVRKIKKAPLTPTALAQIVAAAAKAGYTLEAALQMCCERGWQAFRADWVTPQKSPRGGSLSGMNYGDRDGHFNQ